MKTLKLIAFLMLGVWLVSCQDKAPSTNSFVSLDYYKNYRNAEYSLNSQVIRSLMDSLIRNDSGSTVADLRVKRYYRNNGGFLWIDRHGVDERADTLLDYLHTVTDMGFSPARFFVDQIARDLERLRSLELKDGSNDANHVMARLEYRLTKSFLRYAVGQRFGFMNPTFVFNHLDSIKPTPDDTIKHPARYRGLFDMKMEHADNHFYRQAFEAVKSDDLGRFLQNVQPHSAFYEQLKEKLNQGGLNKSMRARILCNMERCRWRLHDAPNKHKKYVLVNIPSFHLFAIDREDTLSMRIGCGATKTKTPLLNSYIKRMDLNPQWHVPRSILVNDMLHHAGSTGYFQSRNYFIQDKSTGLEVNSAHVTRSMLLSGQYGVVQRGGKGNALGRIIFRFDNNFSVYLHDTSSRSVFGKEDRGVSHGCIRVENPFGLAVFLLADKDERLIGKIKYSMTSDSLSDHKMVVRSVKLQPQVPVFITYFTLYPMTGGTMVEYPDVYGYDAVIYKLLKKYL